MITSVNNPKVVLWSKLKQSKYQKQYEQFIIEERLIIEEAKKANLNMITLALENSNVEADYIVSESVMKKLSQNKSLNDVIAIVDFYESSNQESSKVVYLDNLQDPGNIGTIIRTAYAFGYTHIVLNNGVSKYNNKLISASKGAIFHINISENTEISHFKQLGYEVVGTLLDENSKTLDEIESKDKMLIVFGNEGQGISSQVISELDESVYIPMNNFDSLNVGVVAGIVLYKFR